MSANEKTVKELRAQIETILEKRPELRQFQDEIDRRMSKIIDPATRLQVLSFMIDGNTMLLQDISTTLSMELSGMA